MAKDKNSFILYTHQKPIFEGLSNEYAGLLIKTIFRYVNDENPQIPTEISYPFEIVKATLKSDLKKYKEKCENNRENIRKRYEKSKLGSGKGKEEEKIKNTTKEDDEELDPNVVFSRLEKLSKTKECEEELTVEKVLEGLDEL